MTKEDVWSLFKQTGKVEYYLKYIKMLKERDDVLGDKRD